MKKLLFILVIAPRTLAIVSIHGDTPLTKLTGSGKANSDWADIAIEGIPSLFVIGEYEWWEKEFNQISTM